MAVYFTTPLLRGVGDSLFITAVARLTKQRNRFNPVAVRNLNYSLFLNSPDVDFIINGFDDARNGPAFVNRETSLLPQIIGNRWVFNWVTMNSGLLGKPFKAHNNWPPVSNLILETIQNAGLKSLHEKEKASLRPYFWPYRYELDQSEMYRESICVHSTSASYWTSNKQWPVDRMQEVVDYLRKSFNVIQLGVNDDVLLNGVVDLRGKTTLRETAAILAHSRLFIGMEGGLMHLARAVDTRAVIIYTGFITPEFSGYAENVNLSGYDPLQSVPCWNLEKCNCSCPEIITAADVINGVELALDLPLLDRHWVKTR